MKSKKDPLRSKLSQCVGKICAYLAVGKTADAKVWAKKLVDVLNDEELL